MSVVRFYSSIQGEGRVFSNFHYREITCDGFKFKSSEHAYQAYKFYRTCNSQFLKILYSSNPKEAKKFGSMRSVPMDPDWDKFLLWNDELGDLNYKDVIMYNILKIKFSIPELRDCLLRTGNQILEEDSPTDMYWGRKGKNMLGKLLMKLRSEIRKNMNSLHNQYPNIQ